jgi:hypothetical protein
MAIWTIVRFVCFTLIFSPIPFLAAADENRWWPVQAMPKALVRLQNDLPAPRASCDMMAQSVTGLAAKSVNEGRDDEMVWVGTDNIDMPQEDAEAQGGARGYTPVTWCVERLPASIRTVGPEELIWRIRMKHNPEQTRKLMKSPLASRSSRPGTSTVNRQWKKVNSSFLTTANNPLSR